MNYSNLKRLRRYSSPLHIQTSEARIFCFPLNMPLSSSAECCESPKVDSCMSSQAEVDIILENEGSDFKNKTRLDDLSLGSQSVCDEPREDLFEDRYPKCLDLLPLLDDEAWGDVSGQRGSVDPWPLLGKRKRKHKSFVLQPRYQPEMRRETTFLNLFTEGRSPNRQQLIGSFVSLDAEAQAIAKHDQEGQPTSWSVLAADVDTAKDLRSIATIAVPLVLRPTFQVERSDDVKDEDTSRRAFQPSRSSAFSTSTSHERRRGYRGEALCSGI